MEEKLMEELTEILLEQMGNRPDLPESLKKVIRPYIEAIPEILGDKLDQPATFCNVMYVRILIAEYLIDSDYYKDCIAVLPDEYSPVDHEDFIKKFKIIGKIAVTRLKSELEAIKLKQEIFAISENCIMRMHGLILNKKAELLQQKNKLTIGKLMQLQPTVFLEVFDAA